eukprot:UN03565
MSRVVVSGFASCPYFQKAVNHSKTLSGVAVRVVELSRDDFHAFRVKTLESMGKDANFHRTCPFVFTESEAQVPQTVIGGCDAFLATKF